MNNREYHLSDAIDVIEEILHSGGEFRLYPKGTSMLPLLIQGEDSVVLRQKDVRTVRKWDVIFYKRANGQFVLHRVMKVCKDGTYVLCGDNQTLLEKEVQPHQIIGYVSEIYKNDRLLDPTSLRHRLYMLFWMWMPYRRSIFFVKRGFRFLKRKLHK